MPATSARTFDVCTPSSDAGTTAASCNFLSSLEEVQDLQDVVGLGGDGWRDEGQ